MLHKFHQFRSAVSQWLENCPSGNESSKSPESQRPGGDEPNSASRLEKLKQGMKRLRNATGEKANELAESLARQISHWSGKEVTAEDVKKAARNGAVVGAIVTMHLIAQKVSSGSGSQALSGFGSAGGNRVNLGNPAVSGNGGFFTSGHACDPINATQSSEDDWLEQCRVDQDHLDYIQREEQRQYFDQLQDAVDDQISYNDF